jgi:hypothetical protein
MLNACLSAAVPSGSGSDPLEGVATALVRSGQAAVVGMQFVLTDRAALLFSAAFYESLGAGKPIEAAVAEARIAMHLDCPESPEWAAPVLFLRGAEQKTEYRPTPAPTAQDEIVTEVTASRIISKGEVRIVADDGPSPRRPARVRLQVDSDEISGEQGVRIGARENHGTD